MDTNPVTEDQAYRRDRSPARPSSPTPVRTRVTPLALAGQRASAASKCVACR